MAFQSPSTRYHPTLAANFMRGTPLLEAAFTGNGAEIAFLMDAGLVTVCQVCGREGGEKPGELASLSCDRCKNEYWCDVCYRKAHMHGEMLEHSPSPNTNQTIFRCAHHAVFCCMPPLPCR